MSCAYQAGKKLRFLLVASVTDTKFAAPRRIFCTGYLQGHLNTLYDCALCSRVKVLFHVLIFKSCQSPVSCVDLRWKPRVCVQFQEKYFCWSAVFISKPHEFGWHKKLKSLVFTSNSQGQLFLQSKLWRGSRLLLLILHSEMKGFFVQLLLLNRNLFSSRKTPRIAVYNLQKETSWWVLQDTCRPWCFLNVTKWVKVRLLLSKPCLFSWNIHVSFNSS